MKKSENYGLYVTQNTYQMKWYCFNREAADNYWNGKPCKKAVGDTPQQALSNYKNGVFCKDKP